MCLCWQNLINPVYISFLFFFFSFFFFFSGGGGGAVTVHQDYFTHFESSQSQGGVKSGDPREKTPDYPQAERGLSHM